LKANPVSTEQIDVEINVNNHNPTHIGLNQTLINQNKVSGIEQNSQKGWLQSKKFQNIKKKLQEILRIIANKFKGVLLLSIREYRSG